MHNFYFYFFIAFLLLFYFFGARWPSQPGPITGPSQWPGLGKARMNLVTRAWHYAKVIKLPSRNVLANLKNAKWRHGRTCFWRPKMLAALMDSRLLLPFIFLLCSLVCVFFLFSPHLLKPRRWWRGRPAMNLFWFWVFLCLQGRKQWQSQYSSLFLSFTFRSLFRVFFCSVRALCFVPLCFCSSSLLFSPARLPLPGFL